MKLRIIFLRKKYLYYLIALLTFLVIASIFIFSKKAAETFSVVVDNTTKKADLTGDGKEDILYIKTDKDKYLIQVNTLDKSLYLEPNKKLSTVGSFYSYCPMRLLIMDVSRDKVPEIFIQASEKNKPVQHAFVYNNGTFEDIFCASNNIIGFIDSENSKTPKVLSGNLTTKKIELASYMFLRNKAENINVGIADNFMGKDTIFNFVSYIQSFPYGEPSVPQNMYYPGLSGSDLSVIGKLSGENNTYAFQNAMFKDIKWDKAGEASQITWSLSFKGTSNTTNTAAKNYTLNLKLRTSGYNKDANYFKIYSVTLE